MVLTETGLAKVFQRIKSFIASQLNSKASAIHTHTKSEITDFPTNYVTTDTIQTIPGEKTFTSTPIVKKDSAGDLLYLIDDAINTSNEDENGLPLTGHTNSLKIRGHDTNMIPCMLTGQLYTNGDTSAELRTYKYKDISSSNCRAILSLRYIYNSNYGIATFSNVSIVTPNVTNTANLGSPPLQWNNTYTRNILIDNDINIASSLINKTSNSGVLTVRGGINDSEGASLSLYGKDYGGSPGLIGNIYMTAYGNSDYTNFRIYPNGIIRVYNNSTATTKNVAMQEDVVNLTTAQTIGGEKTFSNLRTYFGRDISCYSFRKYGKNLNPTSNSYQYLNFSGNLASEGSTNDWSSGYLEQVVDTNGGSRGRWFVQDTSENNVALEIWASGNDKQVRPFQNGNTDLGTSARKWKSFNGINPGALSLPSNSYVNVDTTNWDLTCQNDLLGSFTPTADGWLMLHVANSGTSEVNFWIIGGVIRINSKSTLNTSDNNNFNMFTIPVEKDVTYNIYGNASEYVAGRSIRYCRFMPCRGNV